MTSLQPLGYQENQKAARNGSLLARYNIDIREYVTMCFLLEYYCA